MATVSGSDRLRNLQAFDDTKAGVTGLVDAGVTTVPYFIRHQPDPLPVATPSEDAAAIPVINLAKADVDRDHVVAQVRSAAETAGFFQLVNHGVAGELMDEMLATVRRFNEEPLQAKVPYYTRDLGSKVRFSSNFDLFRLPAANWRDTLFMEMAPEATMGTTRHSDPSFLTVLLQDTSIGGLQELLRQRWVDVPPVAGALVVNVGDLLQLVSNDRVRSVVHRVVATGGAGPARVSVACFFRLDYTSTRSYGPIVDGNGARPAVYRSTTADEFLAHYIGEGLNGRLALDHFRLPAAASSVVVSSTAACVPH